MPASFTQELLDVVSPWDDPAGAWVNYNTALGAMFETVFSIVADQGDPNQTQVGSLTSLLSTSAPITSLPVSALPEKIPSGTYIQVYTIPPNPPMLQLCLSSADAAAGATSISINSITPNFAYPLGSPVTLAYVPGWSSLLDPANCPAAFLPFLAQFVGAVVPQGTSAALARNLIDNDTGGFCNCGNMNRGTVAAITHAAQSYLSGTQYVAIIERTAINGSNDPYFFLIVVHPSELVSATQLTNAVNLVKPAGVFWSLVQSSSWIISQMEASQVTLSALEGTFTTLAGLEGDLPGT